MYITKAINIRVRDILPRKYESQSFAAVRMLSNHPLSQKLNQKEKRAYNAPFSLYKEEKYAFKA